MIPSNWPEFKDEDWVCDVSPETETNSNYCRVCKKQNKTHNNEQMHNSATLNSTAVQHGEHNVQQREASGRQGDTQYDTYPLCALQNKMRFRKSGAQESDRAALCILFWNQTEHL